MLTQHLCKATYGRGGNPHTGDPVTNFPKDSEECGPIGTLMCCPTEYVCVSVRACGDHALTKPEPIDIFMSAGHINVMSG